MLEFVKKYGGGIHSQNGEDFVVRETLSRIGIARGLAADVGSHDGWWMSNVRLLIESGWSAVLIEADPDLHVRSCEHWKDRPDVKSICARVNGGNVNALVDETCDVLSIDTDGDDISILAALKAKPKIVIVEVDSCIPPDRDEFNSAGGAGYLPMLRLAISKSYFLLCHTGNEILIDNKYRDLFPEIMGDGISNAGLYFNASWIEGGWHRNSQGLTG